MLEETPSFPGRIFEVDLTPISRPNVNFARSEPPILYTPRTTRGPDFHEGVLGRRRRHIRVLEMKERAELPIITATPNPTSINWWPYPPWGQSTILSTPSSPATPVATEAVSSSPAAAVTAVASSDAPKSATSLSSLIPTPTTPRAPVISIPDLPLNTLPSNPRVHTATNSQFNMLYLIPVLIAAVLFVAISGLLGYRWFSRRRARKGSSDDGGVGSISPFVSGPRYIPMNHDLEAGPEPSPTTGGSPSKYMPHTPRSARPLLSVITGGSSRHSSRHSTPILHPSQPSAAHSASSSHSRHQTEIPTSARSRRSTVSRVSPSDYGASPQVILRSPENTVISPVSVSLSDDDTVPYETIRHKSIRRGILERLQGGLSRSSLSRDPSRRTVQTYFSAPSIYSGTDHDLSRAPSFIIPSSSPPPRVTDWTPGSGFRAFEDVTNTSRPQAANSAASVAGLPGGQPTSAWGGDGAAIRQAVDTHPGERWLAWTRSWASSPPVSPQDHFTVGPTRRRAATQDDEKRDVVVAALPRSPPQLTSGTLHETLTFSPSRPTMLAPPPMPRAQSRAHLRVPARVDSGASDIALGTGHGTPAMRYAARKSAHSRVEDILARSYNSRDLAPPTPVSASAPPTLDNPGLEAFGVRAPSVVQTTEEEPQQDVVFAAGIMHRLAVADVQPLAISARDLMASPAASAPDQFGVRRQSTEEDSEDAFAAGIMQRLADAEVLATDGRHQR